MEQAQKLENYSYEDYKAIDKGTQERVELIFSDIYMMAGASAAHQDVVGNIFYLMKVVNKEKKSCIPRIAPYDIKLTVNNEVSVVQPDVMLLCESDVPCAIFEVLSPSTAYKDKTVKKELYEFSGVTEYFLINVEFKIVEKFLLKEGKYIYERAYGEDEVFEVLCLDCTLEVNDIFEDISL